MVWPVLQSTPGPAPSCFPGIGNCGWKALCFPRGPILTCSTHPERPKSPQALITRLPHHPVHQRCVLPEWSSEVPTLRTAQREAVTRLEFLDLKGARAEGTPQSVDLGIRSLDSYSEQQQTEPGRKSMVGCSGRGPVEFREMTAVLEHGPQPGSGTQGAHYLLVNSWSTGLRKGGQDRDPAVPRLRWSGWFREVPPTMTYLMQSNAGRSWLTSRAEQI